MAECSTKNAYGIIITANKILVVEGQLATGVSQGFLLSIGSGYRHVKTLGVLLSRMQTRPLGTISMYVVTVAVRQQHQTSLRSNFHISQFTSCPC